MFKKISVVLVALCALLSLTACFGSAQGKADEQSDDTVVRIESYLPDSKDYFDIGDITEIVKNTEKREDVLNSLIKAATTDKALPEELVNSYVESFKAYFTDGSAGASSADSADSADSSESADDKALKAEAEALIKKEMVIYAADTSVFKFPEITKEEEKKKAEELAAVYKTDVKVFYTEGEENYIVKSAIREQRVTEKLQERWDETHKKADKEDSEAK